MTLTKADLSTLRHAAYLRERHDAGIGPRGSSQHRHFAKLEKAGLLAFVGWGRDIDAESIEGRDMMVYALTPDGFLAIARHGGRNE